MGYFVLKGAIDMNIRMSDSALRAFESAHETHLSSERYYRLIWLPGNASGLRHVVSTHVTLSVTVAFRYEAAEVPELDDHLARALVQTLEETGTIDLTDLVKVRD